MKETTTLSQFLVKVGVLASVIATAGVAAAADRTIKDPGEIQKILRTVPFADKTMYPSLAERLPNLGLQVQRVDVGALSADDVALSHGLYRRGDVQYVFSTNEPNGVVKKLCPIWSRFTLIRRGGKWLPDDRTSNFLVTGYKCAAP